MSFVTRGAKPPPVASPEAMFRDLPRTPSGPKHLWSHQADILRDYMAHQSETDLAIELPTGAGKTLVGMLVGEWRRRALQERVVYLCPTIQLARQVIAEAGSGRPGERIAGRSALSARRCRRAPSGTSLVFLFPVRRRHR